MTWSAILRVATALSFVLAGFLVLTAMGLAHHDYWPSTVLAVALALWALPPVWQPLLFRIVRGPTPASIYGIVLGAGILTQFALAEVERAQRVAHYRENSAEILDQAEAALSENQLDTVIALEAHYSHVPANELLRLAERARNRLADASSENASDPSTPTSDKESPAQKSLLEKLKNQRIE